MSRNVIDDITNRRAVGTFLYAAYWTRTPNRLVYDIFSIQFADTQTDRQTETSTDNKGRLKLVERKPISNNVMLKRSITYCSGTRLIVTFTVNVSFLVISCASKI